MSASNGHIPERAISFSRNSGSTIPEYMAYIEGTCENDQIMINPARIVYEVPDSGEFGYQCARYYFGDMTKGMSEYKVLCAK